MAREFSAREAKELIRAFEETLQTLAKLASLPDTDRDEAGRAVRMMAARNVCGESLDRYLRGRPDSDPTAGAEKLIASLYRHEASAGPAASARSLLETDGPEIRAAVESLRPAAGALTWLFSSGRNKDAAQKAWRALTRLSLSGYGDEARTLAEQAERARNVPYSQMAAELARDPERYRDIFHQLLPEETGRHSRLTEALTKKLDALQRQIKDVEEAQQEAADRVAAAADRLTAAAAMATLREVPVEELNRNKGGIRVKTLRDNGIVTVADVCAATEYRLSSINGISDEGAAAVKAIAAEYAVQARQGVRVRLSADNRDKSSTELVTSLYAYRRRQRLTGELTDLANARRPRIGRDRRLLEDASGAGWLFCDEQKRAQIREAYFELNDLLEGDYGHTAGEYIRELNTLRAFTADQVWKDFERNSIAYFTTLEELVPGLLGGGDELYGLPEELAREIREEDFFPDGLLCTLRRYQEWGVKYILHQKRVLLGDEMGLGKTVQAIAAMVSLRNTGATHFVVVCPASVLSNWCREVQRHSRLRVTKVHGTGRAAALDSWIKTGGVAVTTYETTGFFKPADDFRFDMMVVDEAHYIKNPEAQRSKNVKRLCEHTDRLLFMTGTALENRVDEMISLLTVLQPQIASSVQGMTFMAAAPQFREKVAPVYYRRKREDVLTELPELIESKEWCALSPAEEQVYEQTLLTGSFPAVRRVSWNVGDLAQSSKASRLRELIDEAESEERKLIVFSFFLSTISDLHELLGERCLGPITGSVPPAKRQEIIDDFDKAPAGSVLLAQIQSGGTGLNIQSASVVVLCEPQFKPSIENQAISRAYRMGQARSVLVYRLLCEETVDERITELLEQKQAVFDAFADKSAAAEQSLELDEAGFGQIIRQEIDRINAKKEEQA